LMYGSSFSISGAFFCTLSILADLGSRTLGRCLLAFKSEEPPEAA
jgi:hypothetical protein